MSNSMNLDLPVVSTTPGPTWASKVNQALLDIAEHTHATGDGVKVTQAGININDSLELNGNSLTEVKTVRLEDQGAVLATADDLSCLYQVSGDIYWRNAAGTSVQLTSGGGINIASVGTIGGDYGQPGVNASVAYSDTTKTFVFLQDSGEAAEMFTGTLNVANEASGALSVAIGADAATSSYALTLPAAAPATDSVLTFSSAGVGTFRTITGTPGEVDVSPSSTTHQVSLPSTITKALTFSGNTSGRGIVPLGAVLATFPHLTGAYACTATTVADANGFVQCAGQTISDGTSPMNGAVIPNINDDVFLMGNVTSGTPGGANLKTISTANLPSHSHDVAGVPTAAHTHDMQHVHNHTSIPILATGDQRGMWSSDSAASHFSSATLPYNSGSSAPPGCYQWSERGLAASGGTSSFLWNLPTNSGRLITNNARLWTAGAADSSGNLKTNTGEASETQTYTSTSVGSGSSFDVRPSYITARYVMRIK